MKKIIFCLTIFLCFNLFFSPVVLSNPKKLCSDVLESLGYKLLSYSFKKKVSSQEKDIHLMAICFVT